MCTSWLTHQLPAAQTRLQAKGNPYRGSAGVVRHIVREQGVRGLWFGSTPSMVRLQQHSAPAAEPCPCYYIQPLPGTCSGADTSAVRCLQLHQAVMSAHEFVWRMALPG